MPLSDLFAAIHEAIAENWPGRVPVRVIVVMADGEKIALPIPPTAAARRREALQAAFVPTAFQLAILDALAGKAMRTDALGAAVHDRRRLYRHPGGLRELREQGIVAKSKRLGYYRPDDPPPQLAGVE